MRHADLLREATEVIVKPASAPYMLLLCDNWYVWVCGRVGVSLVVG